MSTNPPNWYTEFFNEDYPKIYSERLSQEATERETAFVARALGLQEGDRVLDLACGHGRHAVALARRGMVVTGQDLNEDYLQMARDGAAQTGVEIESVHSDMRDIPFTDEFDAVINMFTAFGYFDAYSSIRPRRTFFSSMTQSSFSRSIPSSSRRLQMFCARTIEYCRYGPDSPSKLNASSRSKAMTRVVVALTMK